MLSLQDRVRVHGCCSVKPMVGEFFGKFSEGGNFRNVFENSENSEKYPLPKNTRFTVPKIYQGKSGARFTIKCITDFCLAIAAKWKDTSEIGEAAPHKMCLLNGGWQPHSGH